MDFYYEYPTDNLEEVITNQNKLYQYLNTTLEYVDDIITNSKIWNISTSKGTFKINNYRIIKADSYDMFGPYSEIIKETENLRFDSRTKAISELNNIIDKISFLILDPKNGNINPEKHPNSVFYDNNDYNHISSRFVKLPSYINYVVIKITHSKFIDKYIKFSSNVNKVIIFNPNIGIFHYNNDVFEYYFPKYGLHKFIEYEIFYKKNYNQVFKWGGIYLAHIPDSSEDKYIELINRCDHKILTDSYQTNIILNPKPLLYLMFFNNNIKSCVEFIKTITDINYYKQPQVKLHKLVADSKILLQLLTTFGDEILQVLEDNLVKYGNPEDEYKFNPIYQVINYGINRHEIIDDKYYLEYILSFTMKMPRLILNRTTKILDYLNADILNDKHHLMIDYIIKIYPKELYIGSINVKKDLENLNDDDFNKLNQNQMDLIKIMRNFFPN